MRFEDTRIDKVGEGGLELPSSHREGVSERDVEGMSPSDAVQRYGESFYQNVLESEPGRLGAYERISGDGGREGFARDYARYVLSPGDMREEDPELYDFMRDRIFRGREYEAEEVPSRSSGEPSFGGGCSKLDIVGVDEVSFTGNAEIYKGKLDHAKEHLASLLSEQKVRLDRFERATRTGVGITQYKSDLDYINKQVKSAKRDVEWYTNLLSRETD